MWAGNRAMPGRCIWIGWACARAMLASLLLAKAKSAESLPLFVAGCNRPAICLYEKNGFRRARGVYQEQIEEGFVLREYGYEAAL